MQWHRSMQLAVAAGVLALAACGGTAPGPPTPVTTSADTITGSVVNGQYWGAEDHSVAIRELALADAGPAGYPAGASAGLTMQLWNSTLAEVKLTGISVRGAARVVLVDGQTTSDRFAITIPAHDSLPLLDQKGRHFQVQCLYAPLAAGQRLHLEFHYSNGVTLSGEVPMAGRYPLITAKPSPGPTPAC